MTRVNQYPLPEKSIELLRAERRGQMALLEYCGRARSGRQAELSKKTGLIPAIISRITNGQTLIQMDHAIKLEVATDGELRAELLCPASAALIEKFRNLNKSYE